jgi:hypothetical protein
MRETLSAIAPAIRKWSSPGKWELTEYLFRENYNRCGNEREKQMSRYYGMNVEIKGFDKKRVYAIKDAATEEWGFDDWSDTPDKYLSSYMENSLGGGETEDDFVARLSQAIWKANGKYCEVVITATYLEDLPCEIHTPSEEDYEEALAAWKKVKA